MSSALPIFAVREALEAAWLENDLLVLCAPTGSGKSTCVPRWLAEDALLERAGVSGRGTIFVVEPRRVACRALALHLSRLEGCELGTKVGYAVRFDRRFDASTAICFVTPGVALRMLASGELESRGHTLMLDEFHERSAELDLLAAVGRQRASRDGLRVLFCSATLEAEALADELGAGLVRSEGRSFPVEICYRGDEGPSEDDLVPRVEGAVSEALAQLEGDVLVFLPGRGDIRRCADALRGRVGTAELVEVHGGVPPDRLADAFEGGVSRRVYLSTNVAESSVTLPGVRCVIDVGLVKRIVHRAGRSLLALERVARDAADQRAGRAGRVAAGVCWRLWGRGFALETTTPPELAGIELDDFVLRAAGLGLAGDAFDAAPWVTAPPSFAVESARGRLARVGVLDARGQLTALGRAYLELPVSADHAGLLLDAPECLRGDLADLVARLEVGRSLFARGHLPERVSEARAEAFADFGDELRLELAALRIGDARRHGLDARALSETRKVAAALRGAVEADLSTPERDGPRLRDPAALVRHVLARAPGFAFAPRPRQRRGTERGVRRRSEAWANDFGTELAVYPFEHPGRDEAGEEAKGPEAGLLFGARWVGVGRRARGVGELLMPISLDAIEAAGLGSLEVGTARIERGRGSRRIVATTTWRFSSVERESDGGELRGEALRQAAADLILGGGLYPDLADQLAADALHRDILVTTPPFDASEDPTEAKDAATWLRARLESVGLELNEDLALLEADDLRMPLDAWSTALVADPSILHSIREDFPLEFVDRGGRYRLVEVDAARRRAVLEPHDARAKKLGEPPAKLLPRYRGFGCWFVQASRRVKLR